MLRPLALVAKTVLIEALRRKEIYALVMVAGGLILAAGTLQFFDLGDTLRIYREMALKVMNVATALTMIVLAARQLPREFQNRTVYPLLAKPVGRFPFLLGKFVGVVSAGVFCYLLFMALFLLGTLWMKEPVSWGLFLQSVYLQILGLTVVAALAYMLSLLLNLDATITVSTLIFILASAYTSILSTLYELVGQAGKVVLLALNFLIPHLTLFDLSAKVVHQQAWTAISTQAMVLLTCYGCAFVAAYLALAYVLFRRKPL
jgi:ABC-type transport system involved in multi-copper enzyme maturation permease subunit